MARNQDSSGVCLLVLCGLPGSGKTTLVQKLVAKANQSVSEDGTQFGQPFVVAVHFDELMPSHIERDLVLESELNVTEKSPWKQYRDDICQCVEALLLSFQNEDQALTIKQKPADVSEELWERFVATVTRMVPLQKREGGLCVVLDDNMYYRSMRYTYYQLARKCRAGFCEALVEGPVEDALRRNMLRPDPVSENTVVTMATKLQKPEPVKHSWEKHCVTVSVTEHMDLDPIISMISEAIRDPVQPVPEEDVEAAHQSRQICSTSLLHQIDQILRKLVSQEMSSIKERETLTKQELKNKAGTLQVVRTCLLDDLKSGFVALPTEVMDSVTDAGKDVHSPLFVLMNQKFKEKLDGYNPDVG